MLALGIVTADGRFRRCDRRSNADLYWACRGGGGGNFGVVTSFTFQTHPVGNVSYFFASWDWAQAAEVVRAFQRWAPETPDGLFSICRLSIGSSGPAVQVFGQFLGSESKLPGLVAPLQQVAVLRLSTGSSSYLDAQLRWAGCLGRSAAECRIPPRSSFAAKSDYFDRVVSAEGAGTIVRWIDEAQSRAFGSASILIDSYGGALNRVRPDATAFVHRRELASAQYLAYWGVPEQGPRARAWLGGFHAAMRPHVSGAAYQNYIDPELAGWEQAYYGVNYARLRAVKRRYDPDRLFRFAQAVR